MGLCLTHLNIPKTRRSARLRGRLLGDTFSTDPLCTLQPEPCCAHALAMLWTPALACSSSEGPLGSPRPLDAWVLSLLRPRLLLHPPLPRIRKGQFVHTHLSSLSDMTSALRLPGSAPQSRAETREQPPPLAAPPLLYACAVTPRQSLPGGWTCGECARARRSLRSLPW